jgi:hypothetical protein
MSKKKKNNPVQSYILAIKSMSLASGMMVFGAACDSIKKEWPECEKVEDAYTKFDDSIEKACNDQLGLTSAIVNPCDKRLMETIKTADIIKNEMMYADSYLEL